MWETFQNWLTEFTNNPVVISITTVLSIVGGFLVVLSRTSLGKKFINWSKVQLKQYDEKIETIKLAANNTKKLVDEFKVEANEQYDEFKKEANKKVVAMQSQFELFESDLFKILEDIPNAKVQEKLKTLKKDYESQKQEIANVVGDTYAAIQDKINEEVKKRTEQAQNEITTLKGEIAQLKELVEKTINSSETVDLAQENEVIEHGEETINNPTTKE